MSNRRFSLAGRSSLGGVSRLPRRPARRLARRLAGSSALVLALATCTSKPPDMVTPSSDPMPQEGPCAAAGFSPKTRFTTGSRDGHPDPLGAKAAGQARAGRSTTPDWIVQGPEARQKVRLGDVVLVNDQIAAYIEAPGESDGYMPYGGDLLALEMVDAKGRPTGTSQYGETLLTLGLQAVAAESVTILNDGSDGQAAVVRVSGALRNIPFLDNFMVLAPEQYGFPAALDYSLSPGSSRIQVRLSLINPTTDSKDLSTVQFMGLFHSSRSQLFSPQLGYASPAGELPWVGLDNGPASFALRFRNGVLNYIIDTSGFALFRGDGLALAGCESKTLDYVELTVGPSLDAVAESLRQATGQPAWRTIRGTVKLPDGTPIADAQVHATTAAGAYLTRVTTNASGEYVLHAPSAEVELTPTQAGFVTPAAQKVAAAQDSAQLTLGTFGTLVVHAQDAATMTPLPVRVQVIPAAAVATPPASFGVRSEVNGRLLSEFALQGEAQLRVPVGSHRVVVSRGYEWELVDQTVTIAAGKTTEVRAALTHSVDSSGVMCADFHIHSFYSADSSDPVETKVKSAIADGLEIPISSEHEWIIDFQPIVQRLGMTAFAFGMPSEEFTTFAWGHFGIIPMQPRPEQVNNGAVPWIGKKPTEVFHNIAELPERPVLIINHPRSSTFQGYFEAAGFDRSTATGDPDLWSDEFGAIEVFNDGDLEENRSKSVADWFAILNHGRKVWAVGSSDSHRYRSSPVGYPRTCLRFGHDDPTLLSAEKVRDALRSGDAVVSGGLYMTVTGPGGVRPGGTIPAASGTQSFQIVVQSPKWLTAKRLEIIVDGETVATKELQESVTPQGRRYELTVPVDPPAGHPGPHWVIFNATSTTDLAPLHPGRRPFAVSNPIFF